jgi:hypothetical protein
MHENEHEIDENGLGTNQSNVIEEGLHNILEL